ncbi:hypothetical protein B0O99DRAFT_266889 [Bisporella sp. PMI_857]|nr:hypothetical protein B0O99DRAFT_266889 [Bisporella sp. PMI_857]
MSSLPPLAMSETKATFQAHLTISDDIYQKMAKEVEPMYTWLITNKSHLKENGKRHPPYDWSDFAERPKDEAMYYISQSSNPETAYYWNLAVPTENCPNWIARWFLYHKFRYRDRRIRQSFKPGSRVLSGPSLEERTTDNGYGYSYDRKNSGVGEKIKVRNGSQSLYYDPVRDVT